MRRLSILEGIRDFFKTPPPSARYLASLCSSSGGSHRVQWVLNSRDESVSICHYCGVPLGGTKSQDGRKHG